MLGPDAAGRLEALGRVSRRHPDVGDHDVGPLARDEAEKAVEVVRLADHIESRGCERRCERLAKEDGIVGQNDANRAHRPILPPRRKTAPPCRPPNSMAAALGWPG